MKEIYADDKSNFWNMSGRGLCLYLNEYKLEPNKGDIIHYQNKKYLINDCGRNTKPFDPPIPTNNFTCFVQEITEI